MSVTFLPVDVEAGPASEDGVSLRFKQVSAPQPIERIVYEADDGLDGWWTIAAAHNADATQTSPAHAALVEDSSEGTVLLVFGARHGLVLQHEATHSTRRESYLVLSSRTEYR